MPAANTGNPASSSTLRLNGSSAVYDSLMVQDADGGWKVDGLKSRELASMGGRSCKVNVHTVHGHARGTRKYP